MTGLPLIEQVLAEHEKEPAKLAEWARAGDRLTRRINAIADRDISRYLPPGFAPETGNLKQTMSMKYATHGTARDAFAKHDPNVYARNGGPYLTKLGDILKVFDPGVAEVRPTNWGMAAATVALHSLQKGDHIVASKFLFGGARVLIEDMQKFGVRVTFVDGTKPEAWENAITPKTKLFWFETPGNPTMEVVDIKKVSDIAHKDGRKILVAVDSSLAFTNHTALKDGADIVVTSLTKIGEGRMPGGAILLSENGVKLEKELAERTKMKVDIFSRTAMYGATMAAAAVAQEFIDITRNLPGRVKQQVQTATLLTKHLRKQGIDVKHPTLDKPHAQMKGLSVFAIDLGTAERAQTFADAIKKHGFDEINNFNTLRTGITVPALTTHSSLDPKRLKDQGIGPGLVRVTVGIENPDLVLRVFDAALREAPALPNAKPRQTGARRLAA